MPYARIETSGCGIHKNRAKLRLDFFLSPDDPNYDKHHVYVIDETSKEFQRGYKGKLDSEGNPDPEQYQKWLDGLPHIWRDNPFHSHFIYPSKNASNADIKAEIEKCLNYFYAFHQHCWNEGKEFIEEWKKVPSKIGQVRCPFIKGDSKDLSANQDKVQSILSRSQEFQAGVSKVLPQDLNIGEKGTIDVGSPAIDRAGFAYLYSGIAYFTQVEGANPANASGTIDTVEAWFHAASSGNSVKYGSFEDLGSNELKCHDAEEYGEVSAGSKQTCTGLSIDISSGEYIGADARAAVYLCLEKDYSGGTGIWGSGGQYCDPNDQETFAWNAGHILSLYGTGTEGGVHYDRSGTASLGLVGTGTRPVVCVRSDTGLLGLLATATRSWALTRSETALLGLKTTADRIITPIRAQTALLGLKATASEAVDYAAKTGTALLGLLATGSKTIALSRSKTALLGLKTTGAMSTLGHYTKEAVVYLGLAVTGTRPIVLTRADTALLGLKATATKAMALTRADTALLGLKAAGDLILPYIRTGIVYLGLKTTASRSFALTRLDTALLGLKGIATRSLVLSRAKTALLGLKVIGKLGHLGRALKLIIITAQYRKVNVITSLYRKIKIFTE